MKLDNSELKKRLTPEQYRVLRESATEAPFSGEYVDNHKLDSRITSLSSESSIRDAEVLFSGGEVSVHTSTTEKVLLGPDDVSGVAGIMRKSSKDGSYACGACGETLFMSEHKFDSGSGWPSFYDVASRGTVKLIDDNSHGMHRVEVRCQNCDSHLGHLFEDATNQPTKNRYCINSCALNFNKKGTK